MNRIVMLIITGAIAAISVVGCGYNIHTTDKNGNPVSAACLQAQLAAKQAYDNWLFDGKSWFTFHDLDETANQLCPYGWS